MRLGTDALHGAPSIEWVPQGPFADYRNRVRTPGYALLGFTAGARVAEGIDAFLDVRNITGKRAIGDISAAIDVTDASATYYPVERRAVSAGLRARYSGGTGRGKVDQLPLHRTIWRGHCFAGQVVPPLN